MFNLERIADYGVYTGGMRKSMNDKLWFVGKIDGATEIVDYGCADGALLKYVSDSMPDVFSLKGIDIDKRMLDMARSNVGCDFFTPDEYVSGCLDSAKNACLNCGSVIHEVYSYGTEQDIEKFWNFAFDTGFRYISIRDMAMTIVDAPPDGELYDAIHEVLDNRTYAKQFFDYGWRNDEPIDWRFLVHFLLKYRYVENWEREKNEQYLPLYMEEILLKIPTDKYRVKWFEHYTLPFLKDRVHEDFGIILNKKTHYKLLLERIL